MQDREEDSLGNLLAASPSVFSLSVAELDSVESKLVAFLSPSVSLSDKSSREC